MDNIRYYLDKAGISGLLLGPGESAARLVVSGDYTGPEQLDEGIGILTVGLTSWNAAKYVEEHGNGIRRSPLVHFGRALEVGGAGWTELNLQTGNVDNVFRAFGPALGIPVGAFFEYVAGPIHERISKRYSDPHQ